MTCTGKRTAYQPPDEKWYCPKCGSNSMCIDAVLCDDGDCTYLHQDDDVTCPDCGRGWTGKQVAALMQKRDNVITCPHCKGKGTVDK